MPSKELKIGQHVWLVSPLVQKQIGLPIAYTVDEYRILSFDDKTAVVVRYWDDEHPFEVVDICIHSVFARIEELFFDEAAAKVHAENETARALSVLSPGQHRLVVAVAARLLRERNKACQKRS